MWYVRCAGWSVLALSFWGATAIGFYGWGVLCRAALRLPSPTRKRRTSTCLLGICCTLFTLQLVHCAIPVDTLVLGGWSLVGLAGAISGARSLRIRLRQFDTRALLFYSAAAGWMLYVAYSAMTEIPQSDPYHFVAIRWQQAFPVVPGLANLDGRLGFNNASFLFHSLFSNSIEEFGLSFFHGALYLILFSSGVDAIARSAARQRLSVADACDMLTLFPLIVIGLDYRDTFAIANVTPDLTLFMVQIALVRSWVRAFHSLTSRTPGTMCGEHLALALFLAIVCVCTKLSSAAFSALLICTSAVFLMKSRINLVRHCNLSWSRLVVLVFACAVIWAGRGIVLSGYPLYPSSVLAMPVEWRVAETMRCEEMTMISDWARYVQSPPISEGPHPDGPWLADWCQRFCSVSWTNPPSFNALGRSMLPVSVIALGAMLWAIGSGSGLMRRETWVSLFVAAAGAALVVWFTTAPDPRFAVGIFYAIAIVVLTPTVCRMNCRQRGWLVGSLAATFGIVGLYDRARTEAERHYSTGRVFATLLLPPPPNASGRYIFPNPSLTEHRCDSGLTIYQCDYPWHAPLATVETLYGGWRRLRLRSSQIGLRAGFVRSPGSGA